MYRKLLIILMGALWMAFLSAPVFGQAKLLKFGLRGGLNLAKTTEENANVIVPVEDGIDVIATSQIKNRTAFGLGGFIEFWVSSAFAIQVNGLYNQKGENVEIKLSSSFEPDPGTTVNITADLEAALELTYFSFPVMGKFTFGKAQGIRPYLMAGPEIGILSSAKTSDIEGTATFSVPSQGIYQTEDIDVPGDDIKDQVESVEFALNFGGGIAFPLGSSVEGFLDGRYGLGLSNILKEGEDVKNNVIYLNLGLTFK